jgi:hypothetical protein
MDDKTSYTMLPLIYSKPACKKILQAVERRSPRNKRVCNATEGYAAYGMDASYKFDCWNKDSRLYSVNNLERLIGRLVKNNEYGRSEVVACIGNEASRKESQMIIPDANDEKDY